MIYEEGGMPVKGKVVVAVEKVDDSSELKDVGGVIERLEALFLSEDFADVIFEVGGQRFPAHRSILAANNDYFKALLYGGMRESTEKVVKMEASATAFKLLLKFIYTGSVSTSGVAPQTVMDLLELAHKYDFKKLLDWVVEHLQKILSTESVFDTLDVSERLSLVSLKTRCWNFIDKHIVEMTSSKVRWLRLFNMLQAFLALSHERVKEVLSRPALADSQVIVFKAVQAWLAANDMKEKMMSLVDLTKISEADLVRVVRPSGLVTADAIMSAIDTRESNKEKKKEVPVELPRAIPVIAQPVYLPHSTLFYRPR